MSSTTFLQTSATMAHDGQVVERNCDELVERYRALVGDQKVSWTEHHRFSKLLGQGGQGVVFLSQRRGADDFTIPVAIKIFSPKPYRDQLQYDDGMRRIARIAAKVAQIQQDNLLDVHNLIERDRIRLMEMEWVDGFDLAHLLTNDMLDRVRQRVDPARWAYINNVIVTAGPLQPRLKPGMAIAVLRECLAALAALHRYGIIHSDVKPSNIMLKRTGNSKMIDIGSAFEQSEPPQRLGCTPPYAAPELLEGGEATPRSDLCSLGYVLVEMLSGMPPFAGLSNYRELVEAKRMLVQKLHERLPREVVINELLMNLIRGLIWPDPVKRFPSAEAADLVKEGAASFQRQLVKGDLASEYENEIRLWLAEVE